MGALERKRMAKHSLQGGKDPRSTPAREAVYGERIDHRWDQAVLSVMMVAAPPPQEVTQAARVR